MKFPFSQRPLPYFIILVLLLFTLVSPPAQSQTLTASCDTNVSVSTWIPLRPEVIERIIQARVLEPLLKVQALSVDKSQINQDIHFEIFGRIIEDSGEFTIYVSATPHEKHKKPSVAVMKTASIAKQSHQGIQKIIENIADLSGNALAVRMSKAFSSLSSKFASIEKKKSSSFSIDFGTEWAQSKPRFSGLQGAKEAKAHHELAYCAMGMTGPRSSKQKEERQKCLDALAQLAANSPFAQRAIIAVLLEPPPQKVGVFEKEWLIPQYYELRKQAYLLTTRFTGAALAEAKQAWIKVLSHDYSNISYFRDFREDTRLVEPISLYFERNPDVPNLDMAAEACTKTSHSQKGPEPYCQRIVKAMAKFSLSQGTSGKMGGVLESLQKSLGRVPRYDDGYQTWLPTLETALKATTGTLPAELMKVCVYRIQTAFYGSERAKCIETLGKKGEPTAELAQIITEALLTAADNTVSQADQALVDLVSRNKSLCPAIIKAIQPFVYRGNYPSHPKKPKVIEACNTN